MITIVWAPYEARTATFAKRLNTPLYTIHYLLYKRPFIAPVKYVAQWFKTWLVLLRERPRVIYVTNPPPVAALCVAIYAHLFRKRYIMDTHSPTLFNHKWGWSVPLQRLLARGAYMNIVDQQRFKNLFETWNARALILENPPKDIELQRLSRAIESSSFDITLVCTFARDEPVETVVEAARQLPDVRFFILGNKARAKRTLLEGAPSNVIFTDYLHGDDYWNRLRASRAVMSLTTHAYSLLAGGQDGISVRKPLILSNQPALAAYFTKGAVFVENSADSIVSGVRTLQEKEQHLIQEVIELGEENAVRWENSFQELVALIAVV